MAEVGGASGEDSRPAGGGLGRCFASQGRQR